MGARDLFDDLVTGGWPRIQQWVAATEPESLNLDFKRRAPGAAPDKLDANDKDVLGKAMSGLANVDGGVLVFGLETTQATKGNPNRLAPNQTAFLTDAEEFKRALQKVFGSVTVPPVPGVMIDAITDPALSPTGVVAVLVPSSEAKPHRAAPGLGSQVNNRYYMRTDTDTIVMPHEMLGALFGRQPPPCLRFVAQLLEDNRLATYLRNKGRGTARAPIVRLDLRGGEQLVEAIVPKDVNRTTSGNFMVLEPHTIKTLYSGLEESMGQLRVRRMYDHSQPTLRRLRLAGTILAVDAQPVDFDEIVDFSVSALVELPRS